MPLRSPTQDMQIMFIFRRLWNRLYADASPPSAKLLRNGILKPTYPHGMITTQAEVINADLSLFPTVLRPSAFLMEVGHVT